MGKYERKKPKRARGKLLVIIPGVALVLAALALFVMPQLLYRLSGAEETSAAEETQTQLQTAAVETAPAAAPTDSALSFPLALDNGRLEIESLFQFDGINADCGNEEGDDIASIMLKNVSDAYLEEATIEVEFADGIRARFVVTHLPAGETVMAFASDNTAMEDDDRCVDISGSGVWADNAPVIGEGVTVSVDGVTVTLKNNTAQEIPKLIIYCRTPLGEEYFGGMAYAYTVNNLSAYGQTTVEAVDCIMGLAEVVHIEIE